MEFGIKGHCGIRKGCWFSRALNYRRVWEPQDSGLQKDSEWNLGWKDILALEKDVDSPGHLITEGFGNPRILDNRRILKGIWELEKDSGSPGHWITEGFWNPRILNYRRILKGNFGIGEGFWFSRALNYRRVFGTQDSELQKDSGRTFWN